MNYKVLKNGELLRVHSCKVYPKPYNSTEHMEYVMFNVDDREEIVIESETEIKSAVIRPLSAGISFEISFGKIILSVDRPVKLSVEINGSSNNNLMIFAYKEEFIGPTHNYIKITPVNDTYDARTHWIISDATCGIINIYAQSLHSASD